MGFLFLTLPLIITFFLIDSLFASEITTFVYKGCANQNFQDQSGPKNLNNLLNTLITQSAQKGFSTATIGAGDGDGSSFAVTGLFQRRGDLTLTQCNTCVKKIPSLIEKYCSGAVEPTAARIQLNGCYLKYEVVGFQKSSDTDFLYKVCGSTQSAAAGSGFEAKRDAAFDLAINGVENSSVSGGGGFYVGSYKSVYDVLGQCEGDLTSGDCGECVKIGFESVKNECGKDAIDEAQIYLNKCYVSFRYYANGVPKISDASSSSGIETKRHTQRTVAIAVGGTAALGFLLVILLFIISAIKKKTSSKKHGGWN